MNRRLALPALLVTATAHAAAAQGLIVPISDTREVTASAIEGSSSNPIQQDSQTFTASGFGAFDETANAAVSGANGFADSFASMDSDILPMSMTFVGSAAGNGSFSGNFCADSLSDGIVTFEVTERCEFHFHGFVEGYDGGFAWAYFADAGGSHLGGVFGIQAGVVPFDDSGLISPGVYSVEVSGNGGFCSPNSYASTNYDVTLELTPESVSYCASTPNSTGATASVSFSGSRSINANDFVLEGRNGPPGALGLFLYGATEANTPLGNGTLCLGSPFRRLGAPVASSSSGSVRQALDFTAPPLNVGSGAIQAGSTWRFQWIFRDSVGAWLNFSDGVRIAFVP